jgi:hypothetical protein
MSLMRRSLIAASALIAVLTLAPAALAQQDDSPAPETTPAKPAAKPPANTVNAGDTVPAANPVPKDTTPAGPIIIAPKSSREGRTLFDQKRSQRQNRGSKRPATSATPIRAGCSPTSITTATVAYLRTTSRRACWTNKPATAATRRAAGNLGFLYEKGLGVATNYAEARALYKKACSGGSNGPLFCTRYALPERPGGARDYQQASALFRKACDGAFMLGCTSLGSLYQNGQGTFPDPSQARVFYEEACNGGEIVGCSWLARLYQTGLGGPQDSSQARSLFKKACDRGFRPACDQLSRLP